MTRTQDMKMRDNATENLIKMSESVREEITRDVLDTFGIDLSNQELVYHDKTKPVWTQQICDNKALRQELDSFLRLVQNNVEHLPEMIKFEKEHPVQLKKTTLMIQYPMISSFSGYASLT
ncbi:MAG: hypothetical protein KGH86_03625 [Thaumarchaeota archaeon]|nr:hypothetical protein [Nitrososphaerota archaeon]MDE1875903.1 hypothetical protein [Nitrososphaerota archaeon]